MWKLILAISLTVATVAFAMANTHQTQLFYLVGEPIVIRVIVLIGVCYLAGAASMLLLQIANEARRRVAHQSSRRRRRHLPVLEDDE
jgi:uncharacterized integral membrane protein